MASAVKQVQKLFVYNLPWTVNSQKLRAYFAKFGQVNSANVIFDKNTGLSRHYGFVVFNNQIAFDAAKQANKHIIDGFSVNLQNTN